jgi:hypothetical protein
MDERILTAIRARIPVITASRRLARTLRHQYGELMTARGAAAWETPAVLPWTAWLDSLWEELQFSTPEPPVRLDTWQEWALWDGIIRRSPQASDLLQAGATGHCTGPRAHDERMAQTFGRFTPAAGARLRQCGLTFRGPFRIGGVEPLQVSSGVYGFAPGK